MTQTVADKDTLSTMFIHRWEQLGRKMADLAEAFPESRYETRPVDTVRTFADVLRHVAFWNRYVADTVRGRPSDEAANELPRTEYATKARILAALKDSTKDAAMALKEHAGGLPAETAEMVMTFLEHTSEHYGQLVVYARTQGIVPPASRAGN